MSKRTDFLGLGILVILVIGSFSFSAFAQEESLSIIESIDNSNSAKFIPGQLVVGLEKPDPSFNDKVTLHGGQVINSIEEINAFVVKVPINAEDKFISAISKNPNVSYVERDAIMTALYTPNDTFYSAQWGMQRIGMEQVWTPNFTLGSGIIVAVVDTGIYPDHPDFAGTNILTDSDWDFVDGDADTRPTKVCNRFNSAEFHATFVAGIIAATSDNGVGVAGIGPFDILPVRVLNHCGFGSSSAVANGILWAKNNGADVINLSLGSSFPSTVILNAVNEVHAADVIIVAASGNDGNDSVLYPAGFPNVISVGAITNTDARASYSQFGNTLELSAPGGSAGRCAPPVTPFIVSTGLILSGQTPLFAYLCLIGTSFSAPHVSGVAGLVKDANPSATNEEIRLHLQQTSEDLGSDGYDIQFGFGLVRADSALSISINPAAPSIPTITTPSGTTNITPTTIDGTGDIGSIIELFNGASSLGNQTANGSGDWQFTNVVLAEGDNSFTATASDGVNTSDPSPATVITLDTIAPSIPTITTPSGTTNITPTTIDGTGDIGSIIELFNGASSLGNQTANGSGDWQFTNVVLAEGDNSFTATASDGVNTSDPSPATVITLDTITNDDVPPFLKLVKAVTNDDGGIAQPNDWRLNATANVTTSSNFNNLGGSGNFTAILANNTYTLSEENGPGNYTASSWSCDVGVFTGPDKIQVPLGVNATCTITNDDVPPFLKLVKAVTNDDGGIAQPNDWRLNATANVTTSSNFNNLGGSGNFTAILANNTYTLSEENGPGNYTASSWSCDVGVFTGPDKIQVPLGVNATCTITNDDVAPPSCVPPEFGDWTISPSCTLGASHVAPGNVTVENNALLIIPSGVILDIDYANFDLIVKSGGNVLIKAGGMIT